MPADSARITKRKDSGSTTSSSGEGDHRRRRRNRTTQSCLNCHASKRMCDRRRPACQRCVTLGLSGLCVYEVDDPNQRDGHQDEKDLLRDRVAELEGVIREMKNKPHPKWTQRLLAARDESNKKLANASMHPTGPHTTSTSVLPVSSAVIPESAPNPAGQSGGISERRDYVTPDRSPPSLSPPQIQLSLACAPQTPPQAASTNDSPLYLRPPHDAFCHSLPSPACTPPHLLSPVSELSLDGTGRGASPAVDVTSLLSTTSMDPSGFEEGIFGNLLDHIFRTDDPNAAHIMDPQYGSQSEHKHCGCLDQAIAYNAALELSVRLRKAAETLGQLADHCSGSNCSFYAKLSELDALASATLNSLTSPMERMENQHVNAFTGAHSSCFNPIPTNNSINPTVSPQSLYSSHQWEHYGGGNQLITSEDDYVMTWDGSR